VVDGNPIDWKTVPVDATTIRNIFIYCNRLYCNPKYYPGPSADGGVSARSGRRYNCIWPSVAKHIKDRNFHPLLYISYYFQNYPNYAVQPQQLKSEKWVEAFPLFYQAQLTEVRREWESGLESIQAMANLLQAKLPWDAKRAWRYAIADFHSVQATKLVRLVVALTQNHEDVVEHTWKSGVARYTLNLPVYETVWRPILPEQLRLGGNKLLRNVLIGDL
jgi:hypothetical protein